MLPDCKVIVFTSSEDEEDLVEAINESADGYYLKGGHPFKLLEAMKDIETDGFFIAPKMGKKLINKFRALQDDPSSIIKRNVEQFELAHREKQVLEGLLNNKSYQEIADLHYIGLNTVRYYVKSLYKKVEVSTRKELIKKISQSNPY